MTENWLNDHIRALEAASIRKQDMVAALQDDEDFSGEDTPPSVAALWNINDMLHSQGQLLHSLYKLDAPAEHHVCDESAIVVVLDKVARIQRDVDKAISTLPLDARLNVMTA
jgi:hypothetical protein